MQEHDSENLPELMLNLFKQKLNLHDMNLLELVDVRRFGSRANTTRAIKVELTTKIRKLKILEKAKMLKGTNISIQPEYTRKVMNERKTLKPFLIEAKNKGLQANLVYNKLKIGDRAYSIAELEKKDENNEESTSQESDDDEKNNAVSTPVTGFTGFKSISKKFAKNTQPSTSYSQQVSKRKQYSPVYNEHEEAEDIAIKAQQIRKEHYNTKRHKQQTINTLFREHKTSK